MVFKPRGSIVGKLAACLFRRRTALLCACCFWLPGVSGAAADDCHVPHFTLCDNCRTNASGRVGKNTKCVIRLKMKFGISALKITKQASHGVAGIDQEARPGQGDLSYATDIIYLPENGYSGPDSFSIHVDYLRKASNSSSAYPVESNLDVNLDVVDRSAATDTKNYLDFAGEGVEMTVSWIEIMKEVSPNPGLYKNSWSRALRLSHNNQVDMVLFRNGEKFSGSKGVLGSALNVDSSHHVCQVRTDIVNGRLVITNDCPSHQVFTKISTDGRTSCVATREFRLKPGHQSFEYLDDSRNAHSASDIHSENVACSIGTRE